MLSGNLFNDAGRLGLVIFDPLGLVENDEVGGEVLQQRQVAQGRFVIADQEIGVGLPIEGGPLLGIALHHHRSFLAETLDFPLPLVFQGGRADDQGARKTEQVLFQHGNADRLQSFA